MESKLVTWLFLKKYTPLIRTGGNFGVTLFSSFTAFDFVSNVPEADLILGAVGTASVTTLLAISYEARKFKVSK